MLYALYDYIAYKRRKGRFGNDLKYGIMASAWEGEIPSFVIDTLSDGDPLFFQTFNSFGAWLIMYGTNSQVSHVGIYAEGGRIFHMTPPRSVIEPLQNCFHKDVRILPCKNGPTPKQGRPIEIYAAEMAGEPYGYAGVIMKALRILSGRDHQYFRWKFFLDVSLLFILIDIPIILLTKHPFLSYVLPAYLLLIVFNIIRKKYDPLSEEKMGAPVDAFRFVEATGGYAVGHAYAVRGQAHDAPILRHESQMSSQEAADNEPPQGSE